MVTNQGWSDERLQSRQRVMHTVKETDKVAAKIDLLLKKFEDYSQDKAQMQTLQALEARMTCEVLGKPPSAGCEDARTRQGAGGRE